MNHALHLRWIGEAFPKPPESNIIQMIADIVEEDPLNKRIMELLLQVTDSKRKPIENPGYSKKDLTATYEDVHCESLSKHARNKALDILSGASLVYFRSKGNEDIYQLTARGLQILNELRMRERTRASAEQHI